MSTYIYICMPLKVIKLNLFFLKSKEVCPLWEPWGAIGRFVEWERWIVIRAHTACHRRQELNDYTVLYSGDPGSEAAVG